MRVDRYPSAPMKKRRSNNNACGCLAILGVMGFIVLLGVGVLIVNLPNFALQMAGFEVVGDTESLFGNSVPVASVDVQDARPANSVTVNDANVGNVQLNIGQYVVTGTDNTGLQVAQAQLNEADLLRLCREHTDYCSPNGQAMRNARIDLRGGGAIVRGEVNIPQTPIWQEVGIVMQIIDGNRLEVRGVDIGGTLYALPPDSIGQIVREVETRLNAILRNTVTISGGIYRVQSISSDDQYLTIVLR